MKIDCEETCQGGKSNLRQTNEQVLDRINASGANYSWTNKTDDLNMIGSQGGSRK